MPRARKRYFAEINPSDFADRLRKAIEIRADDECWPFIGIRGKSIVQERNTYGQINLGMKYNRYTISSARAMMILKLGRDLRPGLVVCHMCDWRPCCNPHHLFESTESHNAMMVPFEVRSARGQRNRGTPKTYKHPVRVCECGFSTNPHGMGAHIRATGHKFYEPR